MTASSPSNIATSPSTAYYYSGDGYYTMHVSNLTNVANLDRLWGRASVRNGLPHDSKSDCESIRVGVAVWAKSRATGCWTLLGGKTSTGKWIPDLTYPFTNNRCQVIADGPDISAYYYSDARIASWAQRSYGYPLNQTLAINVSSILATEDTW